MVAEPFNWLKLIDEYSANAVAAPDFIWALCESIVSDENCAQLDLSSLRGSVNSAEPLREDTMRQFAKRFAATGFDPQSFTPAYGMAESTLAISYKPAGTDSAYRVVIFRTGPSGLDAYAERLGRKPSDEGGAASHLTEHSARWACVRRQCATGAALAACVSTA